MGRKKHPAATSRRRKLRQQLRISRLRAAPSWRNAATCSAATQQQPNPTHQQLHRVASSVAHGRQGRAATHQGSVARPLLIQANSLELQVYGANSTIGKGTDLQHPLHIDIVGNGALQAIANSTIAIDQTGSYVFVVGQDNKVEQRRLRVGTIREGLAVVDEGIEPGERVVVQGQQRIRAGMIVTPQTAPAG